MALRAPARLSALPTFRSSFCPVSRPSSRFTRISRPFSSKAAKPESAGKQPTAANPPVSNQYAKWEAQLRTPTKNPQPPPPAIRQILDKFKADLEGRSTAQKLLFFAEKAEDIAKTDPESAEVMQKAAKNLRDWASKPYLNLLSNVFNTAINALLSDPTAHPNFPYIQSSLVDAIPKVDEVFHKIEAQRPESLYYNLMEEMSKKKLELELEKIRANDEPSVVARLTEEQERVDKEYTERMMKVLDDFINDPKQPEARRREVAQFRDEAASFEKDQLQQLEYKIASGRLEKLNSDAERLDKEVRELLPKLTENLRDLRKTLDIDFSQYKL